MRPTADVAPPALAILAGAGSAPLEVAAFTREAGREVHVVGLSDVASDDIENFSHDWSGIGQVARLLHCLKRTGAEELIIIGSLVRPDIWRVRIDWGFIRHIGLIARIMQGGDDAVLGRVVRFFETHGLRVVGVAEAAPEMLAETGQIAGPPPRPEIASAYERGRSALIALSAFDIGQACIACDGGVLAFEDGAGTAELIAGFEGRVADGHAGAVLVKLPKRGQDLRIDLPAIGPDTIAQAHAAGLQAIFVAHGRTVILQRAKLREAANAVGISVVGVDWHSGPAEPAPMPTGGGVISDSDKAKAIAEALSGHVVPGTADVGVLVRNGHAYAILRDGLADGRWSSRLERMRPATHFGLVPKTAGALLVAARSDVTSHRLSELVRDKRLADARVFSAGGLAQERKEQSRDD